MSSVSGERSAQLFGEATAALQALPPRFHLPVEPSSTAVPISALDDPAVARALVLRHRTARRLDQHPWRRTTHPTQVAASLTVQGIAMRLGGAVLAAMVLHDTLLRADAADIYVDTKGPMFDIAIRNGEAVHVADRSALLAAWGEHWLDGNLRVLVDAIAASHRVGRTMLWDNVASAVASSFVFFDWWEPSCDAAGWADAAARFGTPPLGRSTVMETLTVEGRRGLRSERRSCCLAKLIPDGHICPTCPKITEAERIANTEVHVRHLFAVRRGEAVGPPR